MQLKLSQISIIKAIKFVEKIYSDLKKLLPQTFWKKQYYISFYNNITEAYNIKNMRYKSQNFKKILNFLSWVENWLEKKLKRY